MNINNGHSPMSLINHRRRSARWHGASQKVGQSAAPLFLDRIDIQIEVQPVDFDQISSLQSAEPSAAIRQRVVMARALQTERFKNHKGIHCNAQMTSALIHEFAEPDAAGLEKLRDAMTRTGMSARAYDIILKVARTIADLDGSPLVQQPHIMEAIGYRNLDRSSYTRTNNTPF